MKFSIIATGYNCEKFAKECIESVLNQTYTDWELLIYNDASTDKTSEICHSFKDDRIRVYDNHVNQGALYGRYELSIFAYGDVIVHLDLDDKLTPNALEVVNGYYTDEVKMTWGSWITSNNEPYRAKNYPDDVWKNKSFRTAAWKSTALRTFRKSLFDEIPKEEFLYNGEWLKNCTDLAYSYPFLERVEKHEIRVVKELIYIYTIHNNTTLRRFGRAEKTRVREILKRR
jgi:glycosyltransferase involved in cell wall biosynthesis